MNNIVLLSELKKENIKDKYTMEEMNEKLGYSNYDIDGQELKKDRIVFNNIIKNLFMIKNKEILKDFLNKIYDDNLSQEAEITFIEARDILNTNDNILLLSDELCDFGIVVSDKNKRNQYEINFLYENDENISIRIFKYELKFNKQNQSIARENINKNDNKQVNIVFPKPYLIALNADEKISDIYKLKVLKNSKTFIYNVAPFKSWKYDFKKLYEQNMYLLFPLKIVDLKKRLTYIKLQIDDLSEDDIKVFPQKVKLKNLIKDEIFRFFKEMNLYLRKLLEKGSIQQQDIKEFNLISIELLKYFNKNLDNSIERDTVSQLIKTYLN